MIAERTGRRGRTLAIDAAAIVLMVASVVIVVVRHTREPVALSPLLSVEETTGGRTAAVLDSRWPEAWRETGLPDPPALDGGDPVPLGHLLAAVDRWSATGDAAAIGDVGRVYIALEEHEAALACFAALVQLQPGDESACYHLGISAQALGLDTLAIEWLERAAELEPDHATTFGRLAELYLEAGDLDDAAAAYRQYAALRPELALGPIGLARIALARGDLAAAQRRLRGALTIAPRDFLAHRLLAGVYSRRGEHNGAAFHAARARSLPTYRGWLSFDPRLQQAHRAAGTVRAIEMERDLASQEGRTDDLITALRSLSERRPDDPMTLANLAMTYRQAGRPEEAQAVLTDGLTRLPRSVDLMCVRAELEFTRSEFDRAIETLERARSIDDQVPRVHDLLGRTLFMKGDFEAAVIALREAARLDPAAARVRLALATALERTGRIEEARTELLRLIAEDPGNDAARARLHALPSGG